MILHLKTYLSTEELEKPMSVPFIFEFSFHFCIYFLFYGMFVRGSFLIIYCDFAFHRKFLVFDFVIYFLFFYFKFVCFNFCSSGAWRWMVVFGNPCEIQLCFTRIFLFGYLWVFCCMITRVSIRLESHKFCFFLSYLCDLSSQIAWVFKWVKSPKFQIDKSNRKRNGSHKCGMTTL